jgi:sulfhydrogenase subunit beta (sulfur reductase)
MNPAVPDVGDRLVIARAELQQVFDTLSAAGYTLVGPTLRDDVIVYDHIHRLEDLPVGWTDEHGPGHYGLHHHDTSRRNGRQAERCFAFAVGPHAWKKFLYPPELKLFATQRGDAGFEVQPNDQAAPKFAFVGVRACELAAIAVQDRIFIEGAVQEPHYLARRQQAFILAVNCTHPASTCFCASMKTGPRCAAGFDLALTELAELFVAEVGSPLGARMLAETGWRPAGAYELNLAQRALEEAQAAMGRSLETYELRERLFANLDHPRWDAVAQRCLSCGNCTMVCPTCFCSDVQDVSDLSGADTHRVRVWDTCFNGDFSYVYGGNLRPNVRARYRQWLTHKLASWHDQFGTSGCVGCGRCITWCPVGIDITEEAAAIAGEPER